MATNSRIPAWEIPWAEKPGRLQSIDTAEQLNNNNMCVYIYIYLIGSVSLENPNNQQKVNRIYFQPACYCLEFLGPAENYITDSMVTNRQNQPINKYSFST